MRRRRNKFGWWAGTVESSLLQVRRWRKFTSRPSRKVNLEDDGGDDSAALQAADFTFAATAVCEFSSASECWLRTPRQSLLGWEPVRRSATTRICYSWAPQAHVSRSHGWVLFIRVDAQKYDLHNGKPWKIIVKTSPLFHIKKKTLWKWEKRQKAE